MCLDVPQELRALPLLSPDELTFVWLMDWWDGPVTVLAQLRSGAAALVRLHDRGAILGTDRPWRWVVDELTPNRRSPPSGTTEPSRITSARPAACTRTPTSRWTSRRIGAALDAPRDDGWIHSAPLRRIGWLAELPALR